MAVKIAPFFLAARRRRLVSALGTILLFSVTPELIDARKPQLPDTSIARGKTIGGFQYMNGGLTFDEQQAMEEQSAPYNLKIVFAPRTGILTSSVLLMIGHNQARRVDKVRLHGPWFYIQLPPGGYTLLARIKNKVVLIRDVYLRENHRAIYFVRGD